MKKIIISLFALIVCISINAQTVKLYKGKLLVAEYPADQVDNIEFAKNSTKISFSASIGNDNITRTSLTDKYNMKHMLHLQVRKRLKVRRLQLLPVLTSRVI